MKLDNFKKVLYSYFKKVTEGEEKTEEAVEKVPDKKARVKASGSGLNKKLAIGAIGFVFFLVLYSMMQGANQPGNKLTRDEDNKNETVTVGNGNHLKNVPGDYTEEAKMEKEAKPVTKNEKKPADKKTAVQPRPPLPRQPARQEKPRMTLEQQERMEEYEAMKKAYASPIKFELKE